MEIWIDIIGYEGIYQISNYGNVFIVAKNRYLTPLKSKNGYLLVDLWKQGVKKRISIHRLVAINFLKNSENKSQVNHKNGIKTDNRLENIDGQQHPII
jgi:hypothetical protein